MFCVATAPTPARAWAQRAATQGEEEETAMPNMLVGAAGGDRKGHALVLQAASGMTTVTSISTTHSGRARAGKA